MTPNDDNALSKRFLLTLLNAGLLLGSFAAVVVLLFRAPSLENQFWIAIISGTVGALTQQHALSQSWWFGSTKGASDTSQTIRDIATGRSPPQAASAEGEQKP